MVWLELQTLTAEHLRAAVALDQQCLGGLWTLSGYQRELDSPNSDLLTWVALESPASTSLENHFRVELQNRQITSQTVIGVGCLWAILEEAHITLLLIHPDYQGQGLGQALLYALLKSAWKRQLERATLEVRVSNQPALSLYRKFGFKEAGRRRRYYSDTGEDALILWKNGLQSPGFEQTLVAWSQQIRDRFAHLPQKKD